MVGLTLLCQNVYKTCEHVFEYACIFQCIIFHCNWNNFEKYFVLSETAQCTSQQANALLCLKHTTLLQHRIENRIF